MLDQDHLVDAIGRSRIEHQPFSYLVSDRVFRDRDYAAIRNHVPEDKHFVNVAPHVLRLDLVADPASEGVGKWEFDRLLDDTHPYFSFLGDLRDTVLSREVMRAFLKALKIPFKESFMASGRLCYDQAGAGAGPHRDRADKIVSAIFYLPERVQEPEHSASGTQILAPKDPHMTFTDQHYRFEAFDLVEHLDYCPNRVIAFAVARGPGLRQSFHGYRHDAERPRLTLKYHIHDREMLEAGLAQVRDQSLKKHARDWAERPVDR